MNRKRRRRRRNRALDRAAQRASPQGASHAYIRNFSFTSYTILPPTSHIPLSATSPPQVHHYFHGIDASTFATSTTTPSTTTCRAPTGQEHRPPPTDQATPASSHHDDQQPRLAPTPAGTACPRTRPTASSVRERPTPDRPRRTRRRKATTEHTPQRSATTKTDNGAQGITELPRQLQRRLQLVQRQPPTIPTTGGRSRTTVAMAQSATPSRYTWSTTGQRTQQQSTVKSIGAATPARTYATVGTVSCSSGDTDTDIPSEAHRDEAQAHQRPAAHATGGG